MQNSVRFLSCACDLAHPVSPDLAEGCAFAQGLLQEPGNAVALIPRVEPRALLQIVIISDFLFLNCHVSLVLAHQDAVGLGVGGEVIQFLLVPIEAAPLFRLQAPVVRVADGDRLYLGLDLQGEVDLGVGVDVGRLT